MTVVVELRLVIDEAVVRESYDEYVGDVAWYRDNDQLDPGNPDVGYATGTPPPFEEYLAGWTEGIVDDVVGGREHSWRIERP